MSGINEDGTVLHLVRPDALNACVVATMDTEEGRSVQGQMLFKTLCGRYLRRAVAGILRVAWEVVKDVHAAFA